MVISVALHIVVGAVIIYFIETPEIPMKPKMTPVTITALPIPVVVEPKVLKPIQKQTPVQPKQKSKPEPKFKPKPALEPKKTKTIEKPKEKVSPVVQKSTPVVESKTQDTQEPLPETPLKTSTNIKTPLKTPPKVVKSEPEITSTQKENIKNSYLQSIYKSVSNLKKYPRKARKLRQSGTVKVAFNITADGSITSISISEKSGFRILDNAAENIFTTLKKVAPIPKELKEKSITIIMPIYYTLES